MEADAVSRSSKKEIDLISSEETFVSSEEPESSSSKFLWSEVIDSDFGDSGDEEDSGDGDGSKDWDEETGEIFNLDFFNEPKLEEFNQIDENLTCCKLPFLEISSKEDLEFSYPKVMTFLQSQIDKISIDCHLNQIDCIFNYILNCTNLKDFQKANLLNSFLKFRHEILSYWVADYLKLDSTKTDKKFNEIFDISSRRTPDFIFKRFSSKICYIIEVTAVTDYERGLRDKGSEEHGYTSKYQKEIVEIRELGYECHYIVIPIVISKVDEKEHINILENTGKKMGVECENSSLICLEAIRKQFCNKNQEINKILGFYYSSLFDEKFEIKSDFSLDFVEDFSGHCKEFQGKFERISISAEDYFKIYKNWFRMEDIFLSFLKRCKNSESKYSIFLNVQNLKIGFREDKKGLDSEEILEMIKSKDYCKACRFFSLKVGENYLKSRKADFEFFEYQIEKNLEFEFSWKTKHLTSLEINKIDFFQVQVNLETNLYKKFSTKYEDEDYESKLINSLIGTNLEEINYSNLISPPFSSKFTTEKMVDEAVSNFEAKYSDCNELKGSNIIDFHNKQPFIYPFYKVSPGSYIDYKSTPMILEEISYLNFGPYTNRIISIISQPGFEFGSSKKFNSENPYSLERAEMQTEVFNLQKLKYKSEKMNRFPKIKEIENHSYYTEKLSEINKKIRDWESKQPKNKLNLIKLPTKKGTSLCEDFKSEMAHYKKKGSHSIYRGVGRNLDLEFVFNNIEMLKNVLMSPSGVLSKEKLYDDYLAKDVKLLRDLKSSYLEKNNDLKQKLEGTNLFASCLFVSRLCHSLLYYSQTSMNSDYVCVDNLGYNDCILIVKGGKKIFPTKRSKMFRIIYPTYSSHANLFTTKLPTSFEISKINGNFYIITPWISFHETVLTDGLTMVQRCMGFLMLNMSNSGPELDFERSMNKYIFNVFLAFHARRQTEVFMHNMRYLTMNCISDFTSLDEILPELAGFNYDCFQFYIREKLILNFSEFAKKLIILGKNFTGAKFKVNLEKSNLFHFINGHEIRTLEDLSVAVYSTYLMPKAPVTQTLEQVSNLKNVMETHDYYLKATGDNFENQLVTIEDSFENYYNGLFENDFKFDPKYCVLLGKFMGDYMSNLTSESEANQKWETILNKNWDFFANTKGLRGEKDSGFFGEKGYHVVYSEILKENPDHLNEVLNILENCQDYKLVKEKLRVLNSTFRNKIEKEEVEELVFHFVDKIQRAGGREILVMDRKTKILQQPIENYCAYLCKLIPNEMISIPSNKRLSTIHHKVFEGGKSLNERYYLVLDCRKWAPRSVIQKFLLFLSGMRKFLPSGFLKHCYSFFQLMIKNKKGYTKPHILEIIKNSQGSKKDIVSLFIEDKERKGFYFKMPYSWMMGIFNYFSSFMHVANQLHISHILKKVFHLKYNEDINLHMTAHSDDSAGKLDCLNLKHAEISLFIYETLMKASNHLISKKKSNCGKVYYELISILYIAETLLSLLAKFTGMFNFHPTDEGYCSDIKEAYSKCTELVLNGSTFEQAYIGFKIQTQLIENFYFGGKRAKHFYEIPPSLFGIPDPHPLMILLGGSDADIIRIISTHDEKKIKTIYYLNKNLSDSQIPLEGVFRPLVCSASIRKNKRTKSLIENLSEEVREGLEKSWSLKNCNFSNTAFNLTQFIFKLEDPKFRSSLQNEMISRRISRAYFFRTSKCLKTKYGLLDFKTVVEMISTFHLSFNEDFFDNLEEGILKETFKKVREDLGNSDSDEFEKFKNYYSLMYTENLRLCDYFNRISFDLKNSEKNHKTTKPLHIKIRHGHDVIPQNVNVANLCSWIKEKEYSNLLPDTRNFHNYEKMILNLLKQRNLEIEEITIEELYSLTNKIKGKSEAEFFCYSNVPHNLREINTYQDILNYLSHNSFKDIYLRGITAPFGKTITQENLNAFKEFSDPIHWTICFIKICSLIYSLEDCSNLKDLEIKVPNFLSNEKSILKFSDILIELNSYWKMSENYPLVSLEMNKIFCLLNKLNINSKEIGNSYFHCFLKRQFLVENVWLGKGEVFINLGDLKMKIVINNHNLEKIFVDKENYIFNEQQRNYLEYVTRQMQVTSLTPQFKEIEPDQKKTLFLGMDENLNFILGLGEECSRGYVAHFDLHMGTKLTNIELSLIKVNKNFDLFAEFQNFDGRRESYKLKGVLLDPTDCLILMKESVISSPWNREIINLMENKTSKSLMEFFCEEMNLDLFLKKENLIQEFSGSKIYEILKFCNDKSLCNVTPDYPYEKTLPAPDGGVLNSLVKYAQENPNFKFSWEQEVSPSYMEIKNSQPESFVTELLGNLKSKFENLYDSEEKEFILNSLSKVIRSKDYSENLFEMLCTWGYIGVSGALESMENKGSTKTFEIFRVYDKEFGFLAQFSKSFLTLLKAIYFSALERYKITGGFFPQGEENYKINSNSLKYYFTSLIHLIVLSLYSTRVSSYNLGKVSNDDFIYRLLEGIMDCDDSFKFFEESLSEDPYLSNLPFDKKYLFDWMVVYTTLKINFKTENHRGETVDIFKELERIENFRTPFDTSKEILNLLDIKISPGKFYHHGVFNRGFLSSFEKPKFGKYRNQLTKVEFEVKKINESRDPPFSVFYWPKHVFSEDFLDSDEYEDFKLEMESNEPDFDEMESAFENFEGEKFDSSYKARKIKIPVRSGGKIKLEDVFSLKVTVTFDFRSSGFSNRLNGLRQLGENIVIYTNTVYQEILLSENLNYLILKQKSFSNQNFSLLVSDMIYVIIITNYKDVDFWCNLLDLMPTNFQLKNTEFIRSQEGVLIDTSELCKDKSEKNYERLVGEMEAEKENERKIEEISEFDKEIKDFVFKMKEKGEDEQVLKKYEDQLNSDKLSGQEKLTVMEIAKNIMENKKHEEEIFKEGKSKIENVLKETKMTSEQHENIFIIPKIHKGYKSRSSDVKNTSLKEPKLVAELDCITPKLSNKILSGTLTFSSKMKKRISNRLKFYKKFMLRDVKNKENKISFCNLIAMILKDGKIVEDPNTEEEENWNDFLDWLDDKILDEEESEEEEEEVKEKFTRESGISKLNYQTHKNLKFF